MAHQEMIAGWTSVIYKVIFLKELGQ